MYQIAKSAPVALIATRGLGLFLLAGVGCIQSAGIDAKTLAAYRTSFTLAEEPDGVQTVADVRSTLLGESEDDASDHDHSHEGHFWRCFSRRSCPRRSRWVTMITTTKAMAYQDHAAANHD